MGKTGKCSVGDMCCCDGVLFGRSFTSRLISAAATSLARSEALVRSNSRSQYSNLGKKEVLYSRGCIQHPKYKQGKNQKTQVTHHDLNKRKEKD